MSGFAGAMKKCPGMLTPIIGSPRRWATYRQGSGEAGWIGGSGPCLCSVEGVERSALGGICMWAQPSLQQSASRAPSCPPFNSAGSPRASLVICPAQTPHPHLHVHQSQRDRDAPARLQHAIDAAVVRVVVVLHLLGKMCEMRGFIQFTVRMAWAAG
jgi:hypothetical protein